MQRSQRLSVPLIRCVRRSSFSHDAAECRTTLLPAARRNSLPGAYHSTAVSSLRPALGESNSSYCSPNISSHPSPVASPATERLFSTTLKPFDVAWNRATVFGRKATSFPSEIVWLGGAPGAGKGTNSKTVAEARNYSAKTIVMSSLLTSPACEAIKAMGGMVDDATALELLLSELIKPEYKDGVVVDGFPRSNCQVEYIHQLEEKLGSRGLSSKFLFVMLNVAEKTSIGRQLRRGELNREVNESRLRNGLPLFEERPTDSSEEYARHRYKVFEAQLSSLTTSVGIRHPVVLFDAEGTPDKVKESLASTLAQYPFPSEQPALASIHEELEDLRSSWFTFSWKQLLPEIRIA